MVNEKFADDGLMSQTIGTQYVFETIDVGAPADLNRNVIVVQYSLYLPPTFEHCSEEEEEEEEEGARLP